MEEQCKRRPCIPRVSGSRPSSGVFPPTPAESLPFLPPPPTETRHASSVCPSVWFGSMLCGISMGPHGSAGFPMKLPAEQRHLSMTPRPTPKVPHSLRVQLGAIYLHFQWQRESPIMTAMPNVSRLSLPTPI